MIYDYEDAGKLDNLGDVARQTTEALRPFRGEWDSIIVRGMSGALIGAIVSLRLRKPLVVVRKPGESSHGWRTLINGDRIGKRCLFLDDFIATGETRCAVLDAADEAGARVVASYMYDNGGCYTRMPQKRQPPEEQPTAEEIVKTVTAQFAPNPSLV